MDRQDHRSGYLPVRGRKQTISYVDCNGKAIKIPNLAFTTSSQPKKTAKEAGSLAPYLKRSNNGTTEARGSRPRSSRPPIPAEIEPYKASKFSEQMLDHNPPGTLKHRPASKCTEILGLTIKSRGWQGRANSVSGVNDRGRVVREPLSHQPRYEVDRDAQLSSSAFERPRKAPQPPANTSSTILRWEEKCAGALAVEEDAKARGRDLYGGPKRLEKTNKPGFFRRFIK